MTDSFLLDELYSSFLEQGLSYQDIWRTYKISIYYDKNDEDEVDEEEEFSFENSFIELNYKKAFKKTVRLSDQRVLQNDPPIKYVYLFRFDTTDLAEQVLGST